jgi:hypothetical protein
MPFLLHILTRKEDSLAHHIIALQREKKQNAVEVVDLNEQAPDYPALLEKIFLADSVAVW